MNVVWLIFTDVRLAGNSYTVVSSFVVQWKAYGPLLNGKYWQWPGGVELKIFLIGSEGSSCDS